MSVIITDLIRSSFRCIGNLQYGQTHSPTELIDALFILNAMLDSWAADDINAFCTLIQTFTIVSGQYQYTVGPGGQWAGVRPTRVTKATLNILTNPASPLNQDLFLIDADQYQNISLQQTGSTYPTRLWYNPTYASGVDLGMVSLWPVPCEADTVQLSSMQQIGAGFTAGSNAFDAPPGYLDAVRYQLAVALAMEWGMELKAGVLVLATEALAKIQRLNAPSPQMDCDLGMISVQRGRNGWNYLVGGYNGDS